MRAGHNVPASTGRQARPHHHAIASEIQAWVEHVLQRPQRAEQAQTLCHLQVSHAVTGFERQQIEETLQARPVSPQCHASTGL